MDACQSEAHRHPHRRGRRPGTQLGHQERRLPRHGARLRGDRHSARLGGASPTFEPDGPAPTRTTSARSTARRRGAIDRTGGTMLHTSRTNPARMKRDRAAGAARPRADPVACERRRSLRPDPRRARQPRAAGDRPAGRDRWRRHARLRRPARARGGAAGGDPQDDGQRRAGHRVLHRLLARRSRAPRS